MFSGSLCVGWLSGDRLLAPELGTVQRRQGCKGGGAAVVSANSLTISPCGRYPGCPLSSGCFCPPQPIPVGDGCRRDSPSQSSRGTTAITSARVYTRCARVSPCLLWVVRPSSASISGFRATICTPRSGKLGLPFPGSG